MVSLLNLRIDHTRIKHACEPASETPNLQRGVLFGIGALALQARDCNFHFKCPTCTISVADPDGTGKPELPVTMKLCYRYPSSMKIAYCRMYCECASGNLARIAAWAAASGTSFGKL